MIFFIKTVQYISLFLLCVTFSITIEWFADGDKIGGLLSFLAKSGLLYFLLKWISKYRISSAGYFFINGLLSLFTFLAVIAMLVGITGKTSASTITGLIIVGSCTIIPPIFWFKFDVISRIRRRQEERSKKQDKIYG